MTDTMIDRRGLVGFAATAALLPLAVTATAAPAPAPGLAVIAEIVAKPDQIDMLRGALVALAAKARSEPGCLGYLLYEDAAMPGHFYTYEHWTNDAALDAHLASPAMKAAGAQFGTALAKPPAINRLKPL